MEEQRLYEMTRLKDQFAELLKSAGLLQVSPLEAKTAGVLNVGLSVYQSRAGLVTLLMDDAQQRPVRRTSQIGRPSPAGTLCRNYRSITRK